MPFDLVQIRTQAESKEEENWKFRQFLKIKCTLEWDEIDAASLLPRAACGPESTALSAPIVAAR
jgi:hypothetical protein